MEHPLFYNSFRFHDFRFNKYKYNDSRGGTDVHYIGYMKSGHARLLSQTEDVAVETGDILYIPYRCRYQSFWYGDPLIWFDSYGFRYFPSRDVPPLTLQKLRPSECDLALLAEFSSPRQVDCQSVGLLYQLLGQLLPRMKTEAPDPGAALVERAVRYLDAHLWCDVPELAKACGISESGLYATFRTVIGCTPVEMRHRLLTEKATELLTTTDLSVETISVMLGFSSVSYMRRVLHGVSGKTPRELRAFARL